MKFFLYWVATFAALGLLLALCTIGLGRFFDKEAQAEHQDYRRACEQYAEVTGQATRFIQSNNPEADSCWITDHGFTRKLKGDELPW